jgi:hypothetical protein
MVGGQPVFGPPSGGIRPEYPDERLALPGPGAARRRPEPPAIQQTPIALPSGPVAGSGYGDVTAIYGAPGRPGAASPTSSVPASGLPAAPSAYGSRGEEERYDLGPRFEEPRYQDPRYEDDRYAAGSRRDDQSASRPGAWREERVPEAPRRDRYEDQYGAPPQDDRYAGWDRPGHEAGRTSAWTDEREPRRGAGARQDEPRYAEPHNDDRRRAGRHGRPEDDPDALYDAVPGVDAARARPRSPEDDRRGEAWDQPRGDRWGEPESRREPPSRYEALVGPPLRDPPISHPRPPTPATPAPPTARTPTPPATAAAPSAPPSAPPAGWAPAAWPPPAAPNPAAPAASIPATVIEPTSRMPASPPPTRPVEPAPMAEPAPVVAAEPPPQPPPPSRSPECLALWAEAEQLADRATQAHETAATASRAALAAEADYATAVLMAQRSRAAHEAVVRETAEVAAELSRLEKLGPQLVDERTQQETSHAAFVAFRRGDISAEQLREVFKRAEGWTPEHDRLTRRSTELRTEEANAARARIEAERAEPGAAQRARAAHAAAATLEAAARDADNVARLRRTAAEQCEARARR